VRRPVPRYARGPRPRRADQGLHGLEWVTTRDILGIRENLASGRARDQRGSAQPLRRASARPRGWPYEVFAILPIHRFNRS
jgi:hypothetical protein